MVSRPTIADLAAAAGVSVATVDRVLNRRLPVSSDTAQRVVTAAERIGYHGTSLLKRRLAEVPQRRFGFLLQKRKDDFYAALGQALSTATNAAPGINGRAAVDFSEELDPQTIASSLEELASRCDAVAVVALDHPHVRDAIERIAGHGKPVFTLLSDVVQSQRTACLAVDSRKAGRTAAWTIAHMAQRPGQVGVLVGSHRYVSQELTEISFRSYMREYAPSLQVMESRIIMDDSRMAYDATTELLRSHSDLNALYNCGGGQDGLVQALREHKGERPIVTVCNELTAATKTALIDNVLHMVLATPIERLAHATVAAMIAACGGRNDIAGQTLIPAEIYISENV